MSTPKPTAKPSSLADVDFDVNVKAKTNAKTNAGKPANSFTLLQLTEILKNEYGPSDFNFKLFCRRVDNIVSIPIEFIIQKAVEKPSKSKTAKDVVLHYDKLQKLLGNDCFILLSSSKLKTFKIPVTCINLFIKGNLTVKTFIDTKWEKGKPITKKIPYIDHVMLDIDDKSETLAQIQTEIENYNIPVPESESDDNPKVNDDDLKLASDDSDEDD